MKIIDEPVSQNGQQCSHQSRVLIRGRRHYQKKSLLPRLHNRRKTIHKLHSTSTLASEQTRQTSELQIDEDQPDRSELRPRIEDDCSEEEGLTRGAVQDVLQGMFQASNSQKFESEFCQPNLWSYLPSIGEHLSRHETDCLPNPIVYGSHLTLRDRLRAVETLIRMATRLNFKLETIFFAVNIFNRIVSCPRFALVSNGLKCIGSLFVAGKYQEVAIPKIQTFTYLDPSARCSREHVLRMQENILLELNFSLSYISPLKFIDLICTGSRINASTRQFLYRMAQQCLMVEGLLHTRPSVVALACISFVLPQLPLFEQLAGSIREEYEQCCQVIRRNQLFGRTTG